MCMHPLVLGLLVAGTLLPHAALPARILGVFAHPARSNALFTHAVMATLAAAGHDVTVYSPFQPAPGAGFRHVLVHEQSPNKLTYEDFIRVFSRFGFGGRLMRIVAHSKSETFLKHPEVQRLLRSNETFDLVFTGAAFGEESLLVVGHVFSAPTVSLLPSATWSATDYMVGNSLSVATSPEYFAFPFTDNMSLVERLQNCLSVAASLLMYHWYDLPGHDAILQRHLSWLSPPPPSTYHMARDVALTFVNVHPLVSYPKPVSPNIVLIGGIHMDDNGSPLPQDIQKVMDEAEHGVIFCSLGTIVPVESMPRALVDMFINAFRKFPHKVIWKIPANTLNDVPDNIFASPWLPQQHILKHPNLKVFLTHGGLGSQQEALRAGVPVVGIPYFSDQPYNIRFFEHLGAGVGLHLDTLSEEIITQALKTVIYNSSYAENAKRVARIFVDQPMRPSTSVVYWTEYILRHGAAHLRPQAALLPWYQRALLDVVGLALVAVMVVLAVSSMLVKWVYRWLWGGAVAGHGNITSKND